MREGECITRKCPYRGDVVDKVCASNGITYRNIDEVRCLKKYNSGEPLAILAYTGTKYVHKFRKLRQRVIEAKLPGPENVKSSGLFC